jgi:hypothetical protein
MLATVSVGKMVIQPITGWFHCGGQGTLGAYMFTSVSQLILGWLHCGPTCRSPIGTTNTVIQPITGWLYCGGQKTLTANKFGIVIQLILGWLHCGVYVGVPVKIIVASSSSRDSAGSIAVFTCGRRRSSSPPRHPAGPRLAPLRRDVRRGDAAPDLGIQLIFGWLH